MCPSSSGPPVPLFFGVSLFSVNDPFTLFLRFICLRRYMQHFMFSGVIHNDDSVSSSIFYVYKWRYRLIRNGGGKKVRKGGCKIRGFGKNFLRNRVNFYFYPFPHGLVWSTPSEALHIGTKGRDEYIFIDSLRLYKTYT